MKKLLEVRDLRTYFYTYAGEVKAVDGVAFDVHEGEVVAIVGESGCGKSVTAHSILGLIPSPPGKIIGGEIIFEGRDISKYTEKQLQKMRGKEISMIFQDPMTSLNPVLTIDSQLTEVILKHEKVTPEEATKRAVEMLRLVEIPSPEKRLKQYPHEFSGGMRQRVMIAMALACNPKLLIADEPTTALDVTIQAQILELMKDLKERLKMSIILITHDLGIVAGLASRVIVMYAGQMIETASVNEIFQHPKHPYTWGLLRSVPRLDGTGKTRLFSIDGQPPDLLHPPAGCPFFARCNYAMRVCGENKPGFFDTAPDHPVACWLMHPEAPPVNYSSDGEVAASGD